MSFKDPNAPNSPEGFTQHRCVRGRECIPCYQKLEEVKSSLSWNQSTTYLLKKLQWHKQDSRHMKESTTTAEKINIWKLELKTAISRCKKTLQQEQGWNLPWPEGWIQTKEQKIGHCRTCKGAGKLSITGTYLILFCKAAGLICSLASHQAFKIYIMLYKRSLCSDIKALRYV